ncbi:MAG: YlmC/YmxH family sporulation protein [Bacillota bacterium]|uniref:YlmC/YmxH family sporulation protein n=1 Tax=Desulfurispora thermophila TaxID=265470 RepID=UPI000360E405|nr:YlmC/YmxH family sporulation protein [Desulfurispora thermophila]
MVKISDLRLREVINIVDGRRLGPIKDIDIDLAEGRIAAIVLAVPGSRLMGFWGREDEIIVPWEKIVRIGVDVILVEIGPPYEDRREYPGGGYLR